MTEGEQKENDLQTALKCLKIVFDIIWLRFFCLSPCISFFRVSPVCVCVCVAFQHIRPFGRFSRLLGRWHLSCLEKVQKKPFVALPPTTLSSAAVNLIYFNGPRVVQRCICVCVCALSDLSVIYVDIFDFGLLCSALAAAFVIVVHYN